ncbi:hypothetical protein W97_07533 [Coniosporium apollinis CBS 100218]|uniref:Uncharacterized protein n=1 Tax=Coniosporium apollinis (strain CBS 100218) TaxID=1168221 RepID=R7Z248_CONA1|nr:uncharacterized protein W97_07533 [Coniosporium apollinis CBS 100218]EON68275.1 hypothetical protein W97_07533 [Coniosporium apollinis CBS 100218]
MKLLTTLFSSSLRLQSALGLSLPDIAVKHVKILGEQSSHQLEDRVFRDGGHSVAIGGKIIWLFDDTSSVTKRDHNLLSFVSNSVAYASDPDDDIAAIEDLGDNTGDRIDHTWIPFTEDEKKYNDAHKGKERMAIWPGTNPLPISTEEAILWAPRVHVDAQAQKVTLRAEGMTLLSINITQDGPQVTRLVDKIDGAIQYGGFAAVQGGSPNARFVYLFGADAYGLQLAQVPLDVIQDERKRRYYHPRLHMWAETQPLSGLASKEDLYLAGTFSSGSIFFSPYFRTFLMIYFNNVADSTFYLRYLDLSAPRGPTHGKAGHVLGPDDIEALGSFYWSPEMNLWRSPPTKHGYNYAGQVHPEYFNRLYYAPSVYSDAQPTDFPFYGSGVVDPETPDGKHILLSYTRQMGNGRYQVELARLEFEGIAGRPETDGASVGREVGLGCVSLLLGSVFVLNLLVCTGRL